ncbi:MAG: ATP-dependent helicase [Hyperthermus sp.]|nr:MAG: ATP-dependent helicase [Hyperthermus sp.]
MSTSIAVESQPYLDVLEPRLRELIRERGWSRLTSVQERALEPILQGDNVIIVAPTGYGKTEAALLPILSMMVKEDSKPVSLLYITPLRALINDLYERISWWATRLGFRVARKHGDVPHSERARRLRRIPHILVTTPESLEIDLDWASRFREHYRNLRWVIIDEVHEIVGSKRGVQLSVLLERLRRLAGDFQLILLSATIGNPEIAAQAFTGSSKRKLSVITVDARKELSIVIDYVDSSSTGFWKRAAEKLLEHMEPLTIVFVNSKHVAESLHREIEKMGVKGVVVHHASISAEERQRIEASAKAGELDMIIATKTLELGIDIGYARKVILFRPTGQVASLLQRLGRSGHSLHGTIRGVIIATDETELLEAIAEARLAVQGRVEPPALPKAPLDMAARAILGMALTGGHTIEEAYSILRNVYYFRDLDRGTFDKLIEYLQAMKMVKVDSDGTLSIGAQFYRIWRFNPGDSAYSWWVKSFSEFFTTMGEKKNYVVRSVDGRLVGELDSDYVIQILRVGQTIRLGGRNWQVLSIDEHTNKVLVVEAAQESAVVPFWRGRGPEASPIVLDEIKRVIQELHAGLVSMPSNVIMSDGASRKLQELVKEARRYRYPQPSMDRIIVEYMGNEKIYVMIAPIKAIRTLAYVAMLYAYRYNSNAYTRITHYGFSMVNVNGFDAIDLLKNMDRETFYEAALEAAKRSPYIVETAHNIQLVFGVTQKLRSDNTLPYQEALRQTIEGYFDPDTAWEIIELLKLGKIRVEKSNTKVSFYARSITESAPERLWLGNVEEMLADILRGMAFTVEELADALNLPETIIESKLKSMMKPGSVKRVFYFIDTDTGELRWGLVEDAEAIASSEEFMSSFKPLSLDSLYMILAKNSAGSLIHAIIRLDEIISNPQAVIDQIPFKEIHELKVVPLTGYYNGAAPRYTNVPRSIVPYLILNAAAYIQKIQMNNPVF